MNVHSPRIPSPQQQTCIDWARDGTGSAFIEAVAGAGKTTTLIDMLAETTGSVAFAAYNKKIADEINAKVTKLNFGQRVRVGTFHSFGFGAWRRIHPGVKGGPDAARDKVAALTANLRSVQCPESLDGFIFKLVSLAKQRAVGLFGAIDDQSQWFDIIEHFDLAHEIEDEELIGKGVELAIRVLRKSIAMSNKLVDFDDMIYQPIISGCRMWENDWVFVDEAQDTNPARRAMARKMLRPSGRACFVGDRRQSIFGFTGADSDAVDQIIRDFKCQVLPLTVTYRCPKAVVNEARKVVSHIEAHHSAPDGVVRQLASVDLFKTEWNVTDAILCRNTKPLVETAFALIRRGVACHVEGRDIGMRLLKLANRFAARSVDQLLDKLDAYADRETQKLVAKGRETQAEALRDRVDTLKVLAEGCVDVGVLRAKIADMFQDTNDNAKPSLTLSTVHKSKGREWPRVFVLGREALMPSKWARQEWQLIQEDNLIYVATTRAQNELVLVD